MVDFWLIVDKMANSASKIDWVLKQFLTTNYYVNMEDKFKERYAKG